jgi:hypothetical protein
MRLVPAQRVIRLECVLEDALTGDDIDPRRPRNQVPRDVRQQGLVPLLHSVTLVEVHERVMDRSQDRRQCRGRSGDREL